METVEIFVRLGDTNPHHLFRLKLPKLRHFGNILKVYEICLRFCLVLGKISNLLLQNLYVICQICIVVYDQNLTIWSYCPHIFRLKSSMGHPIKGSRSGSGSA